MDKNHSELTWSLKFKTLQVLYPIAVLSGFWLFPLIGAGTPLEGLFIIASYLCLAAGALMALLSYINLSKNPSKKLPAWMLAHKQKRCTNS